MAVRRVLIEATKLFSPRLDGHGRYVRDLLSGLLPVAESSAGKWQFDLYVRPIGSSIRPLTDLRGELSPGAPARRLRLPRAARLSEAAKSVLRKWLPAPVHGAVKRAVLGLFQWRQGYFKRYDLVHLSAPNEYEPFTAVQTKLLTTVHDLSHVRCPYSQREDNVATLRDGLSMALARNSRFLAVSESTRLDLIAECSIPDEMVSVVPEYCDTRVFRRVDEPDRIADVRRRHGIPDGPYIVSLGTIEPRKNLANTVRAFLRMLDGLPHPCPTLVVVGGKGWKVDRFLANSDLRSPHVFFAGYVEDEDLPALYSGALALCYVSHYEGFGLPLLEAMSCGTPVIYGDNSAMPEVVADGGLAADPDDVEDIARKLGRLVTDREQRETLAARALERSRLFSCERTIRGTLAAYERAIGV